MNRDQPATPPPDAELRRWAERQLELPSGATTEDAQRSFLLSLERDGFVPSPHQQYAWEVLRHSPGDEDREETGVPAAIGASACHESFLQELESNLREEIDAFAGRYFELECPRRRQQWQSLGARSLRFPNLQQRLRELAGGLDVVLPAKSELSEDAAQLVREVQEIFTAPPLRKAIRRRALLVAKREDPRWPPASRQLRKNSPEIAALAPEYLECIDRWIAENKRRQRAERKLAGPRPVVTTARDSRIPLWGWLAFVVIAGILALHEFKRHSDTRRGGFSTSPWDDSPVLSPEDRQMLRQLLNDPEQIQRPGNEGLRRLYGIPDSAESPAKNEEPPPPDGQSP